MPWKDELEAALGSAVTSQRSLAGGDINEAYEVQLRDGRSLFVKTNEHTPPRMFEAEAAGLAFLREGLGVENPLVVPEVVHVAEKFLVLEMLRPAAIDQSEELGRGLAALHRAPLKGFGLASSNFIGSLGQNNDPRIKWVDFFRELRLEEQLGMPGARRLIDRETRRRFDVLFERLPELLGPEEPPARLHGDLWGGNSFFSDRGPAIFDPAVYGGHREVDLAMMRLFSGFSARTFAAYQEAYPLSPDFEGRLAIYQLYPLLVHVNLFGAGYVGAVRDLLRQVT
jgi:fructosamine-3-kinase